MCVKARCVVCNNHKPKNKYEKYLNAHLFGSNLVGDRIKLAAEASFNIRAAIVHFIEKHKGALFM